MESVALLNDGKIELTAGELTSMVNDHGIKVAGFFDHTKGSERYAVVEVGGREFYLPYCFRYSGKYIDTKSDIAAFLQECKTTLATENIERFITETRRHIRDWFTDRSGTTLPIFKLLLKRCGNWVSDSDFNNRNSARRIQRLKELGFTIATKIISVDGSKTTYRMLLPFEKVEPREYETFSKQIRKEIFRALNGIDAFTGEPAKISVLPDHKFPEIRWNPETPESNDGLTPEMMRTKFQLVPERINQAKREVCRKCFQTGIRGKLNGINFFYQGTEKWRSDIPKTGATAKIGCCGCFWYDMLEWRKALHKLIERGK